MTWFRSRLLGERGMRFKIPGIQTPGSVLTPDGWAVPTTADVDGLDDALESLDERATENETEIANVAAEVADDTSDDVIVDGAGKGLVLRSPDGHYWRFTANDFGELQSEDLGTERP